jgi:formamidopyrimidine-DNA glycosylase
VPELPDVAVLKRYLDATALHQRIERVDVHSQDVLAAASARELEAGLRGRALESTRRHGKYLFSRLDDDRWLVLHFGMTGRLQYFKQMEREPEYDQVLIAFENGYHLAYVAPRKLGEVELVDDVDAFIADKDLGPDVMAPHFDLAKFQEILSGRRGMIKSALMDQQLMAGVGNVYSDEILFQEGIYPRTRVADLDEQALASLYATMQDVLQTAVDRDADPETFPDSFLTPHRRRGGTCPRCGEELEKVKVSGRSAYYCPNRQGPRPARG